MARKFLTNIDMANNAVQNGLLHPSGTAPTSPVTGQVWYDTSVSPKLLKMYNGTAWESVSGTGTSGVSSLSGTANQISVSASTGSVTLSLPTSVTMPGDLVVTGNLTVSGTTTTVNSETLTVNDNVIVLNNNVTTGTPTENGGVEIRRGASTNASLLWDETNDLWKAGLAGAETTISLAGHTHTSTDVTDFTEAAQDAVATAIVTNGTHTGISAAYNDASNAINLTNTGVTSVNSVTGAVTAANLLTAILTVDGAASGLDADLLDGNHASAFSLTTHNHTVDSLSNVTITSKATGDILQWNGTAWVNVAGVTRKYATAVGDGTSTAITVTHNLNTRDVDVQVYNATSYETVECDVARTTVNTLTLTFAVAPTASQFRVVVVG